MYFSWINSSDRNVAANFSDYCGTSKHSPTAVVWHMTDTLTCPSFCIPVLRNFISYNSPSPTCLHVVISGLPQRRLWSSRWPVVLHLATERFRWLPHASGTLCHPRCEESSHWRRSDTAWKQNYSIPAFPALPDCLTAQSTCVFFSLILYSALATAIAVSRHYNHSLV